MTELGRAATAHAIDVPGADGAVLTLPAALEDDGARYRVSLLKPTGDVAYGPSEPVTLQVVPAPPITGTTVTAGAVRQTYGRPVTVRVAVSERASGPVEVRVGSRTVVGTARDGVAVLRLPARTRAPGRHRRRAADHGHVVARCDQ